MSTMTEQEQMEADGTISGESTQTDAEQSQPRIAFYAVFAAMDAEKQHDAEEILSAGPWEYIGTFKVHGNGGQRAARKAALDDKANKDLKDRVLGGERVWLFCEPANSLHPFPVELDAPSEPRVRF